MNSVTNLPTVQRVFQFEQVKVRAAVVNGQPWVCAQDVARALGYSQAKDMYRLVDDEDKGFAYFETPGGMQRLVALNESGLYSAMLRSNQPSAKPFARWITAKVLPTIRETGRYETVAPASDVRPGQAEALAAERRQAEISALKDELLGLYRSQVQALSAPKRRAFTDAERAEIVRLHAQGLGPAAIGKRLGRPDDSIGTFLRAQGLRGSAAHV